MDLVLVGIGGAAGSLARYQLGKIADQKINSEFPLGTFFINITGAILLGIVTGLNPSQNFTWLLAEGFLGAYTTFSTFMYEGFNLFQGKETRNALFYILGSLVLGILGFYIGYASMVLVGCRLR
jgi:fluoride exporter